MSYHFSHNNSFSKILPYLQIAWDSTSLGLLKECPRKYFYSIICGYTSRSTSIHLTFGLLFHSSLEFYDHMKFSGMDHELALERTLQKLLEDTWDKELSRPIEMDDDKKSRSGLIRTVVWYLDQFQNDPLETVRLANGKPAIELSFQFETTYKSSGRENFLLCGHLDKVAKMDGRTYTVDRKTTSSTLSSSYFDKYSPDNQFSLYDFAGKVIYAQDMSGIIVDAAQIAVTFSRFQRQTIFRTDSIREEWYRDLGEYLFLAEHYAEKEYWPMNDKSCLVGDTEVSMKRGKNKHKITIKELYVMLKETKERRWNHELYTMLLSDIGGKVGYTRMYHIVSNGIKPVFSVKIDAEKELIGTADHKIKTKNGWKEIKDLQIGEEVVYWRFAKTVKVQKIKQHKNTELSKITSITYKGEEEVFDIMMEHPHHNFVANGFIAHNCGNYGGCPFRQVCSKPASIRPQFLNGLFSRRTWDPMIARGDI